MIISDVHKYVFVEMPNTASTAISQELCEHYGGRPILFKHAQFQDFLRVANEEERRYFVFAGSRSPLDVAVTRYYKLRNDHAAMYSAEKYRADHGGHVIANTTRQFLAIREQHLGFTEWFRMVSRYPYDSRGSPDPSHFDMVIRFENLHEDCAELFRRLGIDQVRPIPSSNRTVGREKDYLRYYPPELHARAKACFGPFMRRWGYSFPADWGPETMTWWHDWGFLLARTYRRMQHRLLSKRASLRSVQAQQI